MSAPAEAPILETERLRLRPIRASDFREVEAYHRSDHAAYAGGLLSRGQAWRAMAGMAGQWALLGFGPWAIERRADGVHVGQATLYKPVDWPEKEIGWRVWKPFEGKGYAFEAAREARRFVFEDLGWPTAVSYIDRRNARSIALAERLGAQIDETAATPNDVDCLVYRHTR